DGDRERDGGEGTRELHGWPPLSAADHSAPVSPRVCRRAPTQRPKGRGGSADRYRCSACMSESLMWRSDSKGITATGLPSGRRPLRNIAVRLAASGDRKSTRLNSSHVKISYAVFCLKKKNKRGLQHYRGGTGAERCKEL